MDNDFFIDFESEIEVNNKGPLPHWHQNGKIQFVTFRLADSLPQEKISELRAEIEWFKSKHPKPWSAETIRDFERIVTKREESLLDNGYGSCLLSDARIRRYVSEAINHHDGRNCEVIAFVIMPNHVHILLRLTETAKLPPIIQSIKRYSSTMINRMTHSIGRTIWQRDYHDRMLRNHEHLKYCLHYIRSNPKHLSQDQYELYI